MVVTLASTTNLKKCNFVQNSALRIITGGAKSTPITAMQLQTGMFCVSWTCGCILGSFRKKLSSLFSPSTLHSMNGAVSWDPFGLAYVVFTGILDNGAIGGRIPIFDDIPLLQMTKFQKERFIDGQWLYNDEGECRNIV
ncbi:uncharacterized protein TNCV_254383 [Trichonephila clavipes]|nr:uncharacterized protein TNCV_254383 [Trichonephila clavipes]